MNSNYNNRPQNQSTRPQTAPQQEREKAIGRIYENDGQYGPYLKIYDESNGEPVTYNLNPPKASTRQDAADFEKYDKDLKLVTVKATKVVKPSDRGDMEWYKVEFFNNNGKFDRSYLAYKAKKKYTDKTPDYSAYAKTLRRAGDAPKTRNAAPPPPAPTQSENDIYDDEDIPF